jgi:CO/xanthine dehydrogenase Mo-binding subunit
MEPPPKDSGSNCRPPQLFRRRARPRRRIRTSRRARGSRNRQHRQAAVAPDQPDSWLAIKADGAVVAYFGKMDMGQGVDVAIAQIVAEELDAPFERVSFVRGDTARTINQGGASGSTGNKKGASDCATPPPRGADPIASRLHYLKRRGISPSSKAAAEHAGWESRPSPRPDPSGGTLTGPGIAYAQRSGAVVAIIAEVEINRRTGKVWARKYDIAFDAAAQPVGVDDKPAIMRDRAFRVPAAPCRRRSPSTAPR